MTPKMSIDNQHARDIMGKNYFGMEDWRRSFDLRLTSLALEAIPVVPWSTEILAGPCPFHPAYLGKRVKDTHFLFLGLKTLDGINPLTINAFDKTYGLGERKKDAPISWYQLQMFARHETLDMGWYLLLIDPVPNLEPMPPEYRVTSAIEEVTKDILVATKRRQACIQRRLPHFEYVRCRDRMLGGEVCPVVGFLGEAGLAITSTCCSNPEPFSTGASRSSRNPLL
jgi:hypothetical protein